MQIAKSSVSGKTRLKTAPNDTMNKSAKCTKFLIGKRVAI